MKPGRDAAYEFADHVASLGYEDIPADVAEVTKKNILDVVAVTIAGSSVGMGCREIVELVKEGGGKPESTILGFGGKVPSWMAAFANGSMAHALDYDDTLDDGATHVGAGTIPAALAVAERVGKVTGKQFITAITLGLDMGGRIAMAAQPNGIIVGTWIMPMIGGYFSGTAAAAKILGLTSEQIVNAFGLAYSQCSGGFEIVWGVGSLKGIYPAYPGKSSVLSALMAEKGIPGPKDTLEGKAGLFALYYGGVYDRDVLTTDLGKKFFGTHLSFKPWPSCRWSHNSVEAALSLVSEHDIDSSAVRQVMVSVNDISQTLFEPLAIRQAPTNLTEAQFSMPYTLATAIAKRKVEISAFTPEGRRDPEVLALAQKVVPQFRPRVPGKDFATKVEIQTDTATYSREVERPYGHPTKPISTEDMIKKAEDCFSCAIKPISPQKARIIIERFMNLEKETDMGELVGMLA